VTRTPGVALAAESTHAASESSEREASVEYYSTEYTLALYIYGLTFLSRFVMSLLRPRPCVSTPRHSDALSLARGAPVVRHSRERSS